MIDAIGRAYGGVLTPDELAQLEAAFGNSGQQIKADLLRGKMLAETPRAESGRFSGGVWHHGNYGEMLSGPSDRSRGRRILTDATAAQAELENSRNNAKILLESAGAMKAEQDARDSRNNPSTYINIRTGETMTGTTDDYGNFYDMKGNQQDISTGWIPASGLSAKAMDGILGGTGGGDDTMSWDSLSQNQADRILLSPILNSAMGPLIRPSTWLARVGLDPDAESLQNDIADLNVNQVAEALSYLGVNPTDKDLAFALAGVPTSSDNPYVMHEWYRDRWMPYVLKKTRQNRPDLYESTKARMTAVINESAKRYDENGDWLGVPKAESAAMSNVSTEELQAELQRINEAAGIKTVGENTDAMLGGTYPQPPEQEPERGAPSEDFTSTTSMYTQAADTLWNDILGPAGTAIADASINAYTGNNGKGLYGQPGMAEGDPGGLGESKNILDMALESYARHYPQAVGNPGANPATSQVSNEEVARAIAPETQPDPAAGMTIMERSDQILAQSRSLESQIESLQERMKVVPMGQRKPFYDMIDQLEARLKRVKSGWIE